MHNVFNYARFNAILKESQYPYTAVRGTCKYLGQPGVKTKGWVDVSPNSPNALINALLKGPVSIALRASSNAFRFYSGGILSSIFCGTSLDHAVILVGYGGSGLKKYWIIKNSWGSGWGESGYVRIKRTIWSGAGTCGMLKKNSYPLV